MSIALFNPSIATENVGDLIIIDSVLQELKRIFPNEGVVGLPTQDIIGAVSKRVAAKANHRIVGGTNLLSSHMLRYKQWKINLLDTLGLRDVTLMGVGWWQYQNSPDIYTKTVLRRVLSSKKIHSVRDEYTKSKLATIGINNVINTGCPTMWNLTPDHCIKIPTVKAESVVLTLTDYYKSPENDRQLINLAKKLYRRVYFWPQGSGDLDYLHTLGASDIKPIPATLDAFNVLLESENSLDFVGTRLHGGVRALQKLRRALILAVDNRAREISKDTFLPVLERNDFSGIEEWITNPLPIRLKINFDAIETWRKQSSFI